MTRLKRLFGYIRVSTTKQGVHGVSLAEQKDAIAKYALQQGIEIVQWFEEHVTAAKRGRPVFNQLVRLLRAGKAEGVVIHKLDRSARNWWDWAAFTDLADQGLDVHIAHENLDLRSRSGRLAADIQIAVAVDYIRNLRDETRKGMYGRLKQGLYPMRAPLGYLDRGKGQPKVPDPMRAPLVLTAFQMYATNRYSLASLLKELTSLGLRNRRNHSLTLSGLSTLLNNPFYFGLICLGSTGETFEGIHTPLIRKSTFDRVQAILQGKTASRSVIHDFVFRRMLTCESCTYTLIGERQKGYVYYRCHTKTCSTTAVREEVVDEGIRRMFERLRLTELEGLKIKATLRQMKSDWSTEKQTQLKGLELQLAQTRDRLARLTDAYLDQTIDKPLFEERKTAILAERKTIEEQLTVWEDKRMSLADRIQDFLELAGMAPHLYELPFWAEKRDLVRVLTSNRLIRGKDVVVELSIPFDLIARREELYEGDPYRGIPRTFDALLKKLAAWIKESPPDLHNAVHELLIHCRKLEEERKGEELGA